ncbi:MAG: hypothetical protein Kow00109_26630 [Acidobacteriota bacterium]
MQAPKPSPRQLSRLYGEAYYRGDFGSYGPGGYAADHPNWADWLDLIQYFQPRGTFLDLGCAYGYLVAAARERGYEAYGLDVSDYALRQAPAGRRWCVQGDLTGLPWPPESADVVCLFDVLEHLPDPVAALRECRRVLKPDGLMVLTTPDPLHFDRDDPTHLAERPPSFWLARLEELGLATAFRFSVVPYNFQVLAAPCDGPLAPRLRHFGHDFIGPYPDFAAADGLAVVPRSGWGPLRDGRRELRQTVGSLYLLLPEEQEPFRVRVTGQVAAEETPVALRLGVDGFFMQELVLDETAPGAPIEFCLTLPAGGHELTLQAAPFRLGVLVSELRVTAEPAQPGALPTCLTSQAILRAEAAAHVSRILRPTSILDASGLPNRNGFPAASPRHYWRTGRSPHGPGTTEPRLLAVGPRQVDHPHYLPWDKGAGTRELPAASFDLVACLDPAAYPEPDALLAELDRLASRRLLLPSPEDLENSARERPGGEEHADRAIAADRRAAKAIRSFLKEKDYDSWSLPGPPRLPGQAEADSLLPRLAPELRGRLRAAWAGLCRHAATREHWLLVEKERGSLPRK